MMTLGHLMLLVVLALGQSEALQGDYASIAVEDVKRIDVKILDDALPNVPLEKWLRDIAPGWRFYWKFGGCDQSWDFPEPRRGYDQCVRVDMYGPHRQGWLLVAVGTTRLGRSSVPTMRHIALGGTDYTGSPVLEQLRDLPDAIRRQEGRVVESYHLEALGSVR